MNAKHVGLLLVAAAATLVAEEYPQFVSLMKLTGQAMNTLNKMEKKTGPQAVRVAERLGSIYEEMIPFWRQRNSASAVKISEEGKAAAAQMATAAFAGDEERAAAALKTIGETCKACHDARREKLEDGKYRIK